MSHWDLDRPQGTTVTTPAGTCAIEPGSDFVSIVKSAARNAGLGKISVYLNGSLVAEEDAPDTIEQGDKIEIKPYDKAGS